MAFFFFCCTFMGAGVSGMDMGNQVPSVEGQMVGEGEDDYMPTGHWDTPKEQSTPYPRQL